MNGYLSALERDVAAIRKHGDMRPTDEAVELAKRLRAVRTAHEMGRASKEAKAFFASRVDQECPADRVTVLAAMQLARLRGRSTKQRAEALVGVAVMGRAQGVVGVALELLAEARETHPLEIIDFLIEDTRWLRFYAAVGAPAGPLPFSPARAMREHLLSTRPMFPAREP